MFYHGNAVTAQRRSTSNWQKYLIATLLLLYSMGASAIYSISPGSLSFGNVGVGVASTPMSVTFNNDNSTAAIEFTSIAATGDYTITHNCPMSPMLLDELTSCTITATFTPSTTGTRNGSINITGFDRSIVLGASYLPIAPTVSLTGFGIRGDLVLGSNNLDFGSINIGTTSSSQSVSLSNSGNAAVTIDGIDATAPFSQSNDCPVSLAAGASCTVMVNVTPSVTGDIAGTLTASGSGPQGPTSSATALNAIGLAALVTQLDVSPGSLSFSDTPVGSESAGQDITIINQGTTTISEISLSLSGDFTETNDCPTTLSPDSRCTVTVFAVPTSAGELSGSFQINATDGTHSLMEVVSLSGVGTIADLVTSETDVTFPDASVDTSSEPQTVTLTNQGSAPLTINSISTEGDFSQTNDCGSELAAGSSCDIQVVFSPQSMGDASGALVIDTNQGISRINLAGTADDSGQSPAPSDNPVADLLDPYTGGNPNLGALAEVIGEACPSGRLDDRLQEDCNAVVGAAIGGDSNTAMALDQVNPETATQANNSSQQGGQAQIRNLGSRIAALRAGASGISFQGLDLMIDDKPFSIDTIAQAYRQRGGGASSDNPLMENRLGFFITGDIATGSKDETDLESGLDFDTFGLTMGLDYRINSNFILGAALGYVDTTTELEDDAAEIDTQGYSLNLYGTYYAEQNYFVDFSLGYGANNFDQSRRISYQLDGLANVNQKLSADYDGSMVSLFIGSGYDFSNGPWSFGPRADLEYMKSDVDGFTEEASNPNADGGGWATRVDDTDQTWLTLKLGGRLAYTHSADWGILIPYTRLDWLHEFEDDAQVINAYLVGDPNAQAIRIESEDPDRDYLRLRLGTSAQFKNGVVGFIDYSTILAHDDWTAHTVSVGLRSEF
ncbi:MAG: choice-of-anchor D domain-containing protein [Candidatus Thiodiazotropha taylori]|nr:choice-of-anchor D domain-containing protein [Candidatus Thiodiazotropha taylori]